MASNAADTIDQDDAKSIVVTLPDDDAPLKLPGDGNDKLFETKVEKKPEVDEGHESLRRQLAEAQGRAADSDRRLREEAARRSALETEVVDSNLSTITTALDAAKQRVANAKAEQVRAFERGDYAAVTEENFKLAEAVAEISRLSDGKTAAELEKSQGRPRVEGRVQEQPRYVDKVEEFAAQMSPQSAAWIRAHPDAVHNGALNKKLMAAHNNTVLNDIPADTPEYFRYIEDQLYPSREDRGGIEVPLAPERSRSSQSSAPVSRGNGGSLTRAPASNSVTLTPSQRDFCDQSGISYQAYAKNLVIAQKEGKLQ